MDRSLQTKIYTYVMNTHIKDVVALCSWAAFMENEIQVKRLYR